MKNRVVIVCVAALFAVTSGFMSGCEAKKSEPAKKEIVQAKPGAVAVKPGAVAVKPGAVAVKPGAVAVKPEIKKKVFTKDMGGLTVSITGANGLPKAHRIRAFRVAGTKLSAYAGTLTSGRMQELTPGSYDIEIDTMPPMFYKGINISKERETVEEIGCLSGSIVVKATPASKKGGSFPVRLVYPNSRTMVTSGMSGKPIEVLVGAYDLEIGTTPIQYKKNVNIEKAKENTVDMGATTGLLTLKAVDENSAPVSVSYRVRNAEKGDFIAMGFAGRPLELVAGTYDIDIMSRTPQGKKGAIVKVGEETVMDIVVAAPPKPVAPPAPQRIAPVAKPEPVAKPAPAAKK